MAPGVVHTLLSATLLFLPVSFIFKVNVPFAEGIESVSSFSESHPDHALVGHVIDVCTGTDLDCGLQCLRNDGCQSYNCFVASRFKGTQICHLNNETRKSRPEDFKRMEGSTHFELMQVANSNFVCENNGRWSSRQNHCSKCKPGYKGITCSSKKLGYFSSSPGVSCEDVKDSGDAEGDGEYWVDLEQKGIALKVYCDMTTDGGGWLLVANFTMESSTPPSIWTTETSFRGISNYHNNTMGLSKRAMKELRTYLNFTQLRFHCSKQQGRTFHVTTVANSTGEAVVQYFSGQTDVLPTSCNSFQTLDGDNSQLAKQCDKWGNDYGHYVGKWGHYQKQGQHRLYNHAAFVAYKYHWVIVNGNWLCDDDAQSNLVISPGDFWKIYVR